MRQDNSRTDLIKKHNKCVGSQLFIKRTSTFHGLCRCNALRSQKMVKDRIAFATATGPLGMLFRLRPAVGKFFWRRESSLPGFRGHKSGPPINGSNVVRFAVPWPINYVDGVTFLEEKVGPSWSAVRRA